jgi:hypothetical protein
MGISSGFAPARENSLTKKEAYKKIIAYARVKRIYQSHID